MPKPRPRHPPASKYVTRCDYQRSRGYWVRITREVDGARKLTSKLFSDAVYGGKARAFVAAVKWRDAQLDVLPKSKRRTREPKRRKPLTARRPHG